ncbi:MAG: branched-chain amino acid transport system permease protein [Thermoleophilaceae bacterium]|jgi:branched-chain amino acid transport system permease protein|nr:branched-chain amino acid transport system permease protein [Thermoleophilaceae bacterium]
MSAADGMRETVRDLEKSRFFSGNFLIAVVLLVIAAILPFFFDALGSELDTMVWATAYVVFALGLNIVVGFAGLLDLGYVAFYAVGAYAIGYFASDHFNKVNGGKGIHIGASSFAADQGIHLNFILILVIAMSMAALAGLVIGLPTLRLRGDYIAIVTLAFGEIAQNVAQNGDHISISGYKLSAGQQAISPIDEPNLPIYGVFNSALNLQPYYYLGLALVVLTLLVSFALRESRIGRAWIAVREDEVAASSMGVPLVRTKMLAYGIGAAIGGAAGAFLGAYNQAINSNQFPFSFSILVLAMIILGGLGSIWGTVLGAVILAFVDRYLLDKVRDVPHDVFNLDFSTAEINFGIFGFILVLLMVARPEGLLPERRRKMELTEGVGTDESLFEARA